MSQKWSTLCVPSFFCSPLEITFGRRKFPWLRVRAVSRSDNTTVSFKGFKSSTDHPPNIENSVGGFWCRPRNLRTMSTTHTTHALLRISTNRKTTKKKNNKLSPLELKKNNMDRFIDFSLVFACCPSGTFGVRGRGWGDGFQDESTRLWIFLVYNINFCVVFYFSSFFLILLWNFLVC